jgi:hypothetical protein
MRVEPDDFGAARHVDYRCRLPVDELAPGDYVFEIRVDSSFRAAECSVPFRVSRRRDGRSTNGVLSHGRVLRVCPPRGSHSECLVV